MPSYVIAPAGVSAASFFDPSFVDPAHPPVLLADDIDPKTGELRSLFSGPHPIDAMVQDAFKIRRLSGAANGDVGQEFDKIKKNSEAAAADIQNEARRILKPFLDLKYVSIVTLKVDTTLAFDMGALFVEYMNLHTDQKGIVQL